MHRSSRRIPEAVRRSPRLLPGVLALGAGLLLFGAAAAAPARADGAVTQSQADPLPAGPVEARLLRSTQLRTQPGGSVVTTLDRLTEYGSERVLAVVARRGDWLAVLSEYMPGSRAGWIPAAAVESRQGHYELAADRSQRLLTVRRDGRIVRIIQIAVGRAGLETPTGRFAVTDALRTSPGTPYGCCVLPLTGLQAGLPADRNRLAIHGTDAESTIGSAASSGCLRARSADMRWLLSTITPGTVLRIRA